MKFLVLVLLCGLASAHLANDVTRTVDAVEKSLEGAGRLWMAVDLPEHFTELQNAENHMKTKFGELLKEALDNLVNGVKERVTRVKSVADEVNKKVQNLKDRLRDLGGEAESKSKEAIQVLRKGVRDIVDTLLENVKKHEDNLDNTLDEASKMKVKDVVRQIRQKIVDKVHDIREYIQNMTVDSKAVRELKALLKKLDDSDLGNIVHRLLDLSGHELRHLKDLYNNLCNVAKETDGVLKEKLYNLLGYVKTVWHDGVEELVERLRNIKSNLIDVIGTTKDVSVTAAKTALHHLKEYKEELGDLYDELVASLKKVIGRF